MDAESQASVEGGGQVSLRGTYKAVSQCSLLMQTLSPHCTSESACSLGPGAAGTLGLAVMQKQTSPATLSPSRREGDLSE